VIRKLSPKPALDARKRKIHVSKEAPTQTEAWQPAAKKMRIQRLATKKGQPDADSDCKAAAASPMESVGEDDDDDVSVSVHRDGIENLEQESPVEDGSEQESPVDRFTFILNAPTNTSTCFSLRITGNVPHGYEEDPKLGTWVYTQRVHFKNGKLDHERKRMLDEISFDFKPSSRRRRTRKTAICSSRGCVTITEKMATVSCVGLSTVFL
jgi:hypothetical protein